MKIKLPIYIIHGNHDDPNGLEYLSAIDQFSVNNLLNYFGKIKSIEVIKVSPIKFEKGGTKVAVYGIGHRKDQRLNIALEEKKVEFEPAGEGFLNILVLHQNRYKGLQLGVP